MSKREELRSWLLYLWPFVLFSSALKTLEEETSLVLSKDSFNFSTVLEFVTKVLDQGKENKEKERPCFINLRKSGLSALFSTTYFLTDLRWSENDLADQQYQLCYMHLKEASEYLAQANSDPLLQLLAYSDLTYTEAKLLLDISLK